MIVILEYLLKIGDYNSFANFFAAIFNVSHIEFPDEWSGSDIEPLSSSKRIYRVIGGGGLS
jgi:hypothetical protein